MHNKVIFDEKTNVPPEKRKIGMVFQDYALFPHLTVEKNIAFGLSKEEIKNGRLDEVISMTNLSSYRKKISTRYFRRTTTKSSASKSIGSKSRSGFARRTFHKFRCTDGKRLKRRSCFIIKSH